MMCRHAGLLKDKVCIVTGCGRGIGKSIAEAFVASGAIVYANTLHENTLDEFSEYVNDQYQGRLIPVYFDITESNCIKALVQRIKKEHGKLDVLVNNAGIMEDALIGMISDDSLMRTFDINVFSLIRFMQYAVKIMQSGSIINLSSIAGNRGNKGRIVYSASKGAVNAITLAAAKELAYKGIRVNALAPGMIDTDMFRAIGEERIAQNIESIGMGRLGMPAEVGEACVFLASEMSSYITGQIIGVDGGTVI